MMSQQGMPSAAHSERPLPAAFDPLRMDLTIEEGENAWAIRRAIEAIPELDNLSDFMYCHLAIVVGDDVEDAVKRATHLQTFRQNFRVLDTLEDGRKAFQEMIEILPEFVLALEFHEDSYSLFFNLKGFDASLLTTPEKLNAIIKGYYYIRQCLSADFETIRQGVFIHFECNGYDWTKHLSVKHYRKFWDAFMKSYPFRFTAKWYHTGRLLNVANTAAKKIYYQNLLDDFQIEAPAFLDEIYLQPNLEIANRRLLLTLENALRRRFQMEREFSLEAFSAGLPQDDDEEEDGEQEW
jgi:hypothetical protein